MYTVGKSRSELLAFMEAARPKKKKKAKSRASASSRVKSTPNVVEETPAASEAAVSLKEESAVLSQEVKDEPTTQAEATEDLTSKTTASEPLEEKATSELQSHSDKSNSNAGDEAKVVSDSSSAKNKTQQPEKDEEHPAQESELIPETGSEAEDRNQTLVVPDDEEVKSKPPAAVSETQISVSPKDSHVTVTDSHVTVESTNPIVEPSHVTPIETVEPSAPRLKLTKQTVEPSAPSHVTPVLTDNVVKATAPSLISTNQIAEPSAPPALIDFTENVRLVRHESVEGVTGVETSVERVHYPRLDSFLQEQECDDELSPFSEQDLAILYPNRQLDTNSLFIDNFLQNARQERHPLYGLLITYLKAKQALTSASIELGALQQQYSTHRQLVWKTEMKETFSHGKCVDGSKVSHSHNYKYGVFQVEHAIKVSTALKAVRALIHEELCMKSYSSQLARIHVDNFLFKVVDSYPELGSFGGEAPVTSWVPFCPPSELNPHTAALRDCISVLFMFERRPTQDKEFSQDCRHWLDLLLSALLRIASLSDHRFILNHLLRCPPGVAKWAIKYLHVPSPLHTSYVLHTQFPNGGALSDQNTFTYEWGVESGLYGNWGGPLVDNFITSLATMLLPIKEREALLSPFDIHSQNAESAELGVLIDRQISQPWTFVEDSDEDDMDSDNSSHLLLKETDFISFFEQFSFTELFQHILNSTTVGEDHSMEHVTSHSVLRLIAFGTCLIGLLGVAFSTLKLARYKEFVKQVGRTIRQSVHYIADVWILYKFHRLQSGDTLSSLPSEGSRGDPRYSLNRLQLEFDQFVLRAIRWILSAHKLGAWQFLADMPYSSVSTETVWQIFWNIYCKQSPNNLTTSGFHSDDSPTPDRGREKSPSSAEEIQEAIKDERYKDQFVDHLMKTYTSEAVFLLTTLVNIARARPSHEEELISTIVREIFECTQVVEYAKDAYSRTGHTLLDSIAIVHPFVASTLLKRVESTVSLVGENCILLFKELPLNLWRPTSHDVHVITSWLIDSPLTSFESLLARNILSGLNWGTKSEQGSSELVLPWSIHCLVALAIIEAHAHHLSTQPGGKDYVSSTGLGKYTSLHRFTMTTAQTEFTKWAWEVVLMLKLHPNQVLMHSMRTLNPQTNDQSDRQQTCSELTTSTCGDLNEPPWIRLAPGREDISLPNLTSSSERELAELRDSVKNEGVLAYYVALCMTSIGTDTSLFISSGLPMIRQLITDGYFVPVLRILANTTPRFFNHRDALLEEEGFVQVIVSVCNADQVNASLKEKWLYITPPHVVTKKMAALIQMQLQGACGPSSVSSVGGEKVLLFWLHILLACPNWYRDRSILHLLDTLCMATHSVESWQRTIQSVLLEAYKELNPIQPSKGLFSSMTSSIASMVRQEGGGVPSIFNAISCSECPWLAYHALCAEQTFEEEKEIWKNLIKQLKKDAKASIDTALKRAFQESGLPGGFPSTHLCIYRWAEFAVALDNTHPVLPLVWQRFFTLYLQRPLLDSSMPDRESQGIRLFSPARVVSLRKRMKSALSGVCKSYKSSISKLESGEIPQGEQRDILRTFLPKSLSLFQTFRLWVEEPRLHTAELYLPGLPPQYDANRLATLFKAEKGPLWMEFVPLWEVKGQLNGLVDEWMEIATYQKITGSNIQVPESSPDLALSRLQARLRKTSSPVQPPRFVYINPPVAVVSRDVLTNREALLVVVKGDLQCVLDQARSYCTKLATAGTLDEQYTEGLPHLYTNELRQFHVRVPCHSRFNRSRQCQGPATIVFRIEEMTVQPRYEQDLNVNRSEYKDMLAALSKPVIPELCQLVMKLENTVSELSKMAAQSPNLYPNVPLQNGIALFYEILGFVNQDTRHYPPSRQVLTSCLQVLGQEFVQRDALQTNNLLNQLLSQRGNSDILAPLFQPNLCPDQFVNMYGTAAEVAIRESPSVAFSVLTKFNIPSWVTDFDPHMDDRSQLLQFISQGLCLSGPSPSLENALLVELYRRHFVQLIEHKFPDQYYDTLRMVLTCTDNGSITVNVWNDLCTLIGSHDQMTGCKLGLKQIQDSIKLLSSNYVQQRMTSGQTLYSLLVPQYVPEIGKFIKALCQGLVERWAEAVSMETLDYSEAVNECWAGLVEMFLPWVVPISTGDNANNSTVLPPCLAVECEAMAGMMNIFVEVISLANSTLKDRDRSVYVTHFAAVNSAENIMSRVWSYYCSSLSLPHTPSHITHIYHTALVQLPWATFTPDLAALDSMMQLKLVDSTPRSCFVFLGQIFPMIMWKKIAAIYHDSSSHENESTSFNFHVMMLQLLVMLAAEDKVMSAQDTGIPEVIAEAHSFHWETVDAKTYEDVVNWQKKNCDPFAVVHTGSCLFLSLRLLKSAAGFPTSDSPPEHWHNDTWKKRMAYIHLVVDLIGRSTLTDKALSESYSDALSHLYQTVVDICVHEYSDYITSHIVPLMQAVLNVFSCCQSSEPVLDMLMNVTFDILDQLPNAHLLTLPTVTASCNAIHSVRCMVRVIEYCTQCHFKAVPKPHPPSAELPKDPLCMYGWKSVLEALTVPEDLLDEFCQKCITEFAVLTLHAHLLQRLPQCTSMAQEARICAKVVGWSTQVKPRDVSVSNPLSEAKMFLLWEKSVGLLLRQIRYGGSHSELIPLLSSLAASMVKYGEDKASEGLLGAIGFGKKSIYSYEFRLVSRVMAAFIYCQMPVDHAHTTQLRVVPNAPGHIKDSPPNTPHTPSMAGKAAAKQAQQTLHSLESLMTNKNYLHLREHVLYGLEFLKDPSHCIMDCTRLLVHLCTTLYDSCRFLDLLKVLEE